jgi:hypothetical protein
MPMSNRGVVDAQILVAALLGLTNSARDSGLQSGAICWKICHLASRYWGMSHRIVRPDEKLLYALLIATLAAASFPFLFFWGLYILNG